MIPAEKLGKIDPNARMWTAMERWAGTGFNRMPVMLENDFVGMLLRGDNVIYLQTASARIRQETAAPAGGYSVDKISLMSGTDVLQPSESLGAAESVRGYTLRDLISSGDVPFKWVESKSDEQRGSIVACGQI